MEIDNIDEPKVDNQRKRFKKMFLDEDEADDIEKPNISSSMSESIGLTHSSITEDENTFSSELEFNDFSQYARWLTCKVRICWKIVIEVRTWKMCVCKQELISQFEGAIFILVE